MERKELNGKPYAGNPHVRFDEGEVASAATLRRGSLLYKLAAFHALLAGVFAVLCCAGCGDAAYEMKALRNEVAQLKAEVRELKRRIERRGSMERVAHPTKQPVEQSRGEVEARRRPMHDPEARKKAMEEHRARFEERRRQHEERRREMEERRRKSNPAADAAQEK